MEKRLLGKTDMHVSLLGFGGVEINGVPHEEVRNLLHEALDSGLNVIDTAECYGNSEELIGRTISDRRDDYYLFTKCGHASGFDFPDWDIHLLTKTLERSLQRLKTDRVDLLLLHTCPETLLRQGDVIEFLQKARDEGKTRYIGFSGDGQAALYAIQCRSFDVLETSINIADQQAITLTLPLAQERNMGIIAKRPLANACWRTGSKPKSAYQHSYWDRLQTLNYSFLQENLDKTFEIALRFVFTVPGVHTAIVGTTNIDHWYRNLETLKKGPLADKYFETIRRRWQEVAQGTTWAGER